MDNTRSQTRHDMIYYLRVRSRQSGNIVGRIVDLTTDGFRLYTEEKIEPDTEFQLTMDIPDALGGDRQISLAARSVWCRRSSNPDFFEVGFQTDGLSSKDRSLIRQLIRDSWVNN